MKKFAGYDQKGGVWRWAKQQPCTVVSLFELGCVERGLSYLEGGPIYELLSPHIGGLADTVNSLYAIRRLVFDEGRVTLDELLKILKNNWEGQEALRQYVLNRYSYYGNDFDEVDAMSAAEVSVYGEDVLRCLRAAGKADVFDRIVPVDPDAVAFLNGIDQTDDGAPSTSAKRRSDRHLKAGDIVCTVAEIANPAILQFRQNGV